MTVWRGPSHPPRPKRLAKGTLPLTVIGPDGDRSHGQGRNHAKRPHRLRDFPPAHGLSHRARPEPSARLEIRAGLDGLAHPERQESPMTSVNQDRPSWQFFRERTAYNPTALDKPVLMPKCSRELWAFFAMEKAQGKAKIPPYIFQVLTLCLHEKRLAELSSCKPLFFMVGHVGVEPTTNGLRVRCSTN